MNPRQPVTPPTGAAVRVESVNLGLPRALTREGHVRQTGIFKEPTPERVVVAPLGLGGDHVLDGKVHGGPGQAVYLYGVEDYAWWASELGRDLPPGTFGENLTVSGLDVPDLRTGDRLVLPDATLEFTAPRVPCETLAARMGDPGFVKRFARARRPGVYARVLAPGSVQVGESGRLERASGDLPGILERFDLVYDPPTDREALRRLLAAPIDERSRARYTELLARLGEP
ncbi:MAG TPA: MOSC domain-containing protein [Deinococcales bacterium]|nr:MOSC domain-containing protein [Deinococcales bacterium]